MNANQQESPGFSRGEDVKTAIPKTKMTDKESGKQNPESKVREQKEPA